MECNSFCQIFFIPKVGLILISVCLLKISFPIFNPKIGAISFLFGEYLKSSEKETGIVFTSDAIPTPTVNRL